MPGDLLLDRLIRSPRLGQYLDRLNDVWAAEQRRRERFYDQMTEGAKQEFINGEVVVHSPVRLEHERASGLLHRALSTYVDKLRLGKVAHEKLLIALSRNDYEPDVCFFGNEKASHFTPRQMKFPAPDLIAEVLSDSTESTDRGIKFEDYAAHGVGEYWIVDPARQTVEQYVLRDGAYELRAKAQGDAIIDSAVVPGFKLPVDALFDEQLNLAFLSKLLAR